MPDENLQTIKRAAEEDDAEVTTDVKRCKESTAGESATKLGEGADASPPVEAPTVTEATAEAVNNGVAGEDGDVPKNVPAVDLKTASSTDATAPKSSTFASTSKGVREFLLEAASTAARDTGTTKAAGNSSSGAATSEKKSGFGGGGFGAFKAGPNPLLKFAESPGSGFGGGFGSKPPNGCPAKATTLLDSMKKSTEGNGAEAKTATSTSSKVLTGEEDEETMFEDQAKVYRFDAQELKWRERGKGELKVKKRVKENGDSRFRLLLREPHTERILINMSITQAMSHEISKIQSKQVRVTGVNIADDSQAINAFMIVFKSGEVALSLQDQLAAAIGALEAQAANSGCDAE